MNPIPIFTIPRDGKTTAGMGLTTQQIPEIVRPVTQTSWKGVPLGYHAEVAITAQSHAIQTVANSKGPSALACDGTCHHPNPVNYTQFADNKDIDSTTVCNTWHSPHGPYNGVSDSVIGAKPNWASGVYDGSTLNPGKEKWCVGCHDNDPALIDGVDAPKVGGDGLNYGYFANGHSNAPNNANLVCTDCHDLSLTHIDGEPRTYEFDPADYNDGSSYRVGCRFIFKSKMVS